MKKINDRDWYYAAVALVLSVLAGILIYVGVPVADDLWFSVRMADGAGFSERLEAAFRLMDERRMTDMLRLGNQPLPLLLMVLPRWVSAVLAAVLCLFAIEGGRRVAGVARHSVVSYLWIAGFFLLLPWYDYILSVSYMMNYLFPTAIVVWTVWWFVRINEGMRSGRVSIGVLALSMLAGWSHEGFSAPLICGMAVMIGVRYLVSRRVSGIGVCMMLTAMMGCGVIFLSPVLGARASEGGLKIASMPIWEMAMQLGPSVAILLLAVIGSVPALIRRAERPRLLMLLTMAVAAEVVAMVFYNGPRTTWAAVLYSLLLLATLPEEYGRKTDPRRSAKQAAIAAIACCAIVAVNLQAAIRGQHIVSEEIRTVERMYDTSADGEIYLDVTRPGFDASLMKTTVRTLNERVPLRFIEQYYSKEGEQKPLTLLPEALRGFSPSESVKVADGCYLYHGYAVAVVDPESRGLSLTLTMADGASTPTRYHSVRFHGADGKEYLWLRTHVQTLDPDAEVAGYFLR